MCVGWPPFGFGLQERTLLVELVSWTECCGIGVLGFDGPISEVKHQGYGDSRLGISIIRRKAVE